MKYLNAYLASTFLLSGILLFVHYLLPEINKPVTLTYFGVYHLTIALLIMGLISLKSLFTEE